MPNILPQGEKAAAIAIVSVAPLPGGPLEASRLKQIMNNYNDIPTAVIRQQSLFASNNGYLMQFLSCFTDQTAMRAAGIWIGYNSSSPPLTNPVLVVNSNIEDTVYIAAISPAVIQSLTIMGFSNIANIAVDEATTLNYLYIGPNTTVQQVDSSSIGAAISQLNIPTIKSKGGKVLQAVYGSTINSVILGDQSYYGGPSTDNPVNTCATPVTNLNYGIISHNTIQLTWVNPYEQSPSNSYLFVNTYYRVKGEHAWSLADSSVGEFNNDSGFTFNQLACDTTYEFYVQVVCVNGAVANSSTLIVATTVADC